MSAATRRKLADHTITETDKLLHLWTVAVSEGVLDEHEARRAEDALLDLRSAAAVFVVSPHRQEATA